VDINSKGLHITAGRDNSGKHVITANNIESGVIDIQIDSGTGIGGCTFLGNRTTGAIVDNGDVTSYYAGA
jgi:hypothetical protein